jgi:serine/threonine protein kinase
MCATVSFTWLLISQEHHDKEVWRINEPNLRPQEPSLSDELLPFSTSAAPTIQVKPKESIVHDSESLQRVIYFEGNDFPLHHSHRYLHRDPMLSAPPGEEAVPQLEHDDDDANKDGCVPMAEWQTRSFPNCNVIHELDLTSAGPNVGKHQSKVDYEDLLLFLGRGWFRHTWRLDTRLDSVVLKTLRLERDFMEEYYELHRRDAVAMERLTHSPFVLDVYGYCGQSAINELADFPHGLSSLEKFVRQLRGKDGPDVAQLKLQIAASVAVGVAHIHGIDDRPSLVHYDLNPRNVAIVKGGKPKLNDFNIAEFLRVNPETNETCGFPARMHEPWWRAPEEVRLGVNATVDEKVDVYALGNLLFDILTTRSPRGKMKKERMEEVREHVVRGEPPKIPPPFNKSKDKISKIFRQAMRMCFEKDPKKRATAREVAELLTDALQKLQQHENH